MIRGALFGALLGGGIVLGGIQVVAWTVFWISVFVVVLGAIDYVRRH